jgi:predicted ATPase/DNA-binding SARP family transcriptional activator
MAQFKLYVLGYPHLERDGVTVSIPRRKIMALLAYRAVNAGDINRDELAELFWPNHNQKMARAELRRTLSNLRKILGQNAIPIISPAGAQAQVEKDTAVGFHIWLDLAEFRRYLHEATVATKHLSRNSSECLESLSKAVQLYHAHFLAGFTLKDSSAFDEWQTWQAERLKRELLEALQWLSSSHLERSEYAMALRYAQQWVESEPEEEAAHCMMMRIYAANGQRGAAMTQYRICQRLLRMELGIEPAVETTRLFESIRDSEPGRVMGKARQTNLPAQLTRFIGREKEIAALCELISRERMVTLTGPGGVGKTRLAIQVGQKLSKNFADGIFFVDLADIREVNLVLSTIARVFELIEIPRRPIADALKKYLAHKNLLLILDNFEQVLEAGHQVVDLLAAAPKAKVLITSRETLRLYGEQNYQLMPLPLLEKPLSYRNIVENEAVQLFVMHAKAAQSNFHLNEDNAPIIYEICHKLDGLPLAIELAAARVRLFTPKNMLALLGHRLQLLVGGERDMPHRQQTLRASFEWSHALLSSADQSLFRRLSVFDGGCTLEAAKAVCSEDGLDVLTGIESLLDKHLLERAEDDDETRFLMFETVREFALDCLDRSGESLFIHCKHADYYVELKEKHLQHVNWLEKEIGNLRAVMRWSIDSGQLEPGFRIVCYDIYWGKRNHEWQYWLEEMLRAPGAQFASEAKRPVIFSAFLQALYQQNFTRCQILFDEYLILAKEPENKKADSYSLYMSGYLCVSRQDYVGACENFAEGMERAETDGDLLITAWSGSALGFNIFLLNDADQAEEMLHTALDMFTRIEFLPGRLNVLTNLGYIALEKRVTSKARQWFKQAVREARLIGEQTQLRDCLIGLAVIALQQDELLDAVRLFAAAQILDESFGSVVFEPLRAAINERYLAILHQRLDPVIVKNARHHEQALLIEDMLSYAIESDAENLGSNWRR